MSKVVLALVAVFMVGCANPYQTARSTIKAGRGIVIMSQTGFDTYVQIETQKCQDKCKADPACMTACMEPVKKNTIIYQKAKLLAIAGLDEADTMVDLSEKLKKKEPINWMPPLTASACLLARSLVFLKEADRKKIEGLIELLTGFGCPK